MPRPLPGRTRRRLDIHPIARSGDPDPGRLPGVAANGAALGAGRDVALSDGTIVSFLRLDTLLRAGGAMPAPVRVDLELCCKG